MNRLLIAGLTIGTAALLIAVLIDIDAEPYARELIAVAVIGYMCAFAALICRRLDKVNRPADEAFDTGFELGRDKGWRECSDSHRPKIVHLEERRRSS